MKAWLTPDTLPVARVCRVISIPDDPFFIFAVNGALLNLTFPTSWEDFGAVSSEDAAEAMTDMWYEYAESVCSGGGDMEHIARLDGVASSYVFDNLPQTYRQIMAIYGLKSDRDAVSDSLGVIFNGDTGGNYTWGQNQLFGTPNHTASNDANDNQIVFSHAVGAQDNFLGDYSGGMILFPNYRESGMQKAAVLQNFNRRSDFSISAWVNIVGAGHWHGSLVDVDEIEFFPVVGSEFDSNSFVDLYGLG